MSFALVVVDGQYDFFEGGSLGAPGSLAIIPVINSLSQSLQFAKVVFTCDWHPLNHVSFAINHEAATPFSQLPCGTHVWPVHCVQHSPGAALHDGLKRSASDGVVTKGSDIERDCFSGFGDATAPTALLSLLREAHISEVVVVGLCLDYCVGATALDAVRHGFGTTVVTDATVPVAEKSGAAMLGQLGQAGVRLMGAAECKQMLQASHKP